MGGNIKRKICPLFYLFFSNRVDEVLHGSSMEMVSMTCSRSMHCLSPQDRKLHLQFSSCWRAHLPPYRRR